MRQISRKRILPVVTSVICFISIIVALTVPFLYTSLTKSNILGFCLIFGGKYIIGGEKANISFNVALFIALLLIFSAGIFSFFCRKIHRANSLITILLLIPAIILFFASEKFCVGVIYDNPGFKDTCYLSCGPYIVNSLNGLALLIWIIDMIKKR